jgi:hypothetical protein
VAKLTPAADSIYQPCVCSDTYAQAEIDGQKFAELLLAEFPQHRDDVHEWSYLLHLQMMEFHLVTEKAFIPLCLPWLSLLARQFFLAQSFGFVNRHD